MPWPRRVEPGAVLATLLTRLAVSCNSRNLEGDTAVIRLDTALNWTLSCYCLAIEGPIDDIYLAKHIEHNARLLCNQLLLNASLHSSKQHKLFRDTQMNLPNLVHKTSATLLGVATLVLGADLVHAMTKEALVGKAPVCHGEKLTTVAHHADLLSVEFALCTVLTHAVCKCLWC